MTANADKHLLERVRRELLRGLGGVGDGSFLPAPQLLAKGQVTEPGLLAWSEYVDQLKSAGELSQETWFPDDDQTRAELYRQLVMNVAQAYIWYFQASAEHPDWMPFENSIFLLQPNPDGIYHLAPIDGRGTYRIVGNRGKNPIMNFYLGGGLLGSKEQFEALERGEFAYGSFDADTLTIGPGGAFEFVMSSERPEGWTGDWWPLDPRARTILVRQFSNDWGNEAEARFAIERLDKPALKPRLTAAEIAQRLELVLGDFVGRFSKFALGFQNDTMRKLGLNTMELTGYEDMGNDPAWPQKYWQCLFDHQPDEALIIETDIPSCKYWNVQLNDTLWNQMEFGYRQSSLNGHQAKLDSDGRFRAVVAATDPGVPNWLDSMGFSRGMLIGRWHTAESHPMPTIRKVPLADVRDHLPSDTPLVNAEEREITLRARNIGLQLRRRW